MSRMRIAVIADSRKPSHLSPLVTDLVEAFEVLGHDAAVIDPDAQGMRLDHLSLRADLYVLKSGTEAALSLAGALDHLGARVLNPYAAAAACRDKVVQTAMLAGADVPLPDSWLTTDPGEMADELVGGPLIVKDPRGSRGRGLHVVRQPHQLRALERDRPWLVMRYHAPVGDDLKLYRIGHEVFGVRRRFPARTLAEKRGVPAAVDPDLREVVMRCGEPFGIDLYGVDVIHSDGRPWVVDMSSFPGFKGVPDAAMRIADHAVRWIHGPIPPVAVHGRKPPRRHAPERTLRAVQGSS
ncbi:hypothetical protein [Terrabacter aeriphilus]